MHKVNRTKLVAAMALVAAALPSWANPIPYPTTGTVASASRFVAEGALVSLYFAGANAGDGDQMQLIDLTTGNKTGWVFSNHATTIGAEVSLATNAGDLLEFQLKNVTTGDIFSSLATDSADGINHVYATAFDPSGQAGDLSALPAGKYLGFEDLVYNPNQKAGTRGNSDLDYNDLAVIVVGDDIHPAPEPSSLALLGGALLAIGRIRKGRETP